MNNNELSQNTATDAIEKALLSENMIKFLAGDWPGGIDREAFTKEYEALDRHDFPQ